jgi:hypothetical protein
LLISTRTILILADTADCSLTPKTTARDFFAAVNKDDMLKKRSEESRRLRYLD